MRLSGRIFESERKGSLFAGIRKASFSLTFITAHLLTSSPPLDSSSPEQFGRSAFAKTHTVASYDVDAESRLTLPALLRQLHDTAQSHVATYGFGYRDLLPKGLAWALVSIELRLTTRPLGESEWVTRTAVARAAGPLVYRDYVAESAGERFCEGQSLWALIDLTTRKTAAVPDELAAAISAMRCPTPMQAGVSRVGRLKPARGQLKVVDQRKVRPHDCDFNGHLNNVVTARWLLDAALEVWPKLRQALRLVRLTYHQEALLGETLTVNFSESKFGDDQDRAGVYLELRNALGSVVANAILA